MTNDSQLIAKTFYELQLFCRDISLLLKTGEEVFKRKGWKSAQPDKTCQYAGSYSLDRSHAWLPLRYFRYYSNPLFPTFLTYIAVLIDLPPGRERQDGMTYLTAGGLNYSEEHGWGNGPTGTETRICRWHINSTGAEYSGEPRWYRRPFLQWTDRVAPEKWNRLIEKVDTAVTLALPLHEIGSADHLESRVINPLLTAIKDSQNRDAKKSAEQVE